MTLIDRPFRWSVLLTLAAAAGAGAFCLPVGYGLQGVGYGLMLGGAAALCLFQVHLTRRGLRWLARSPLDLGLRSMFGFTLACLVFLALYVAFMLWISLVDDAFMRSLP